MIVEIFRLTCSSCHQSPCLQLLPLASLRDRLSVPAPAPYSCKRATTSHLEPDKSIRPLPASCYSCSAAISLNSINLLLLTTFSPSGLPLLCDMCSFLQKKKISMKNFSQVLGLTIAQKLHLLKLQMTCFLRQTKATSYC